MAHTEIEDLHNPKPLKTQQLWRGNNMQGFQLNVDPKRGPIGAVLPTVISFPTSSRHQATVTIEVENEDGSKDEQIVSMRDWKGFRPASEAKGAKAKREWILYYLETKLEEVEQSGREAKHKPEDIRAEQRKWTELVYRANDLGDPPGDILESKPERPAPRKEKPADGRA